MYWWVALDICCWICNIHLPWKTQIIFYLFYLFWIAQLLDINECDENSAICDKHTQLCLNTKGGYECKDKVVEKCMAGLKYNIQSKQCEGGYKKFFIYFYLSFTKLSNGFSFNFPNL